MNKLQMRRYAKLLAKTGVNVKRGQWVVVQTELDQPVEAEPEIKEKEQTQEKSDDLDD